MVGFSTPNNCGYIAEGQGGMSKCYICGIDVQRLACQPSKLDVGVRIPYSAPEARIGPAEVETASTGKMLTHNIAGSLIALYFKVR